MRAVKFNIDQMYIYPIAALGIFYALLNLKLYSIKKKELLYVSNSNQTSRGIELIPPRKPCPQATTFQTYCDVNSEN